MVSCSSNPLISVILPTYNRADWLTQAVDSVLNQTYAPVELIVVDDGSTDGTADLLTAYGPRLTVLRQVNSGVSAARNRGIREAAGQWIAFIDSDDCWLPQKLARQVAFIHEYPEALICQTEEIWMRNGKRVNPKKRHRKFAGMIFKKSLPLCLISPSAVMVHKLLLKEVGLFDESLPACEDYDLWLRITWKYPVYLVETPLIIKRGGHPDQLSRMPELDKLRIRALAKIIRSGCLSAEQSAAALATLEEKCLIYAGGCFKRGRSQEAAYYRQLPARLQTALP